MSSMQANSGSSSPEILRKRDQTMNELPLKAKPAGRRAEFRAKQTPKAKRAILFHSNSEPSCEEP